MKADSLGSSVRPLLPLLAALGSAAAAGARPCANPFERYETQLTIEAGGNAQTGPMSCSTPNGYSSHVVSVPAGALFFDSGFILVPPGGLVPGEVVFPQSLPPLGNRAFFLLPGPTRKTLEPVSVSMEFHSSDIPSGFTSSDMRPYIWRANAVTSWWEQMPAHSGPTLIVTGAWKVTAPVSELEAGNLFSAQPGLVKITSPATGAVLDSNTVTVSGTVKFRDIRNGTSASCTSFALTVNGQSVSPNCTLGTFSTSVTLSGDGEHEVLARLTGPSGDVSTHSITIETDTTPPVLLRTSPEHEDTFSPATKTVKGWYQELHGPVTAVVTESSSPVMTQGCSEPDCFQFTDSISGSPATYSIILTDAVGNESEEYEVDFYAQGTAYVYGLVLDAIADTLIPGMAIEYADDPTINADSVDLMSAMTIDGVLTNYELDGTPEDLDGWHLIKFLGNADGAPTTTENCDCPACPYSAFGLAANVKLKKGYYVLNAAPREPVKLPPLQVCEGITMHSSGMDQNVDQTASGECTAVIDLDVTDPVSETTLRISAGTVMTLPAPMTTCEGVVLSVTEVPRYRTP